VFSFTHKRDPPQFLITGRSRRFKNSTPLTCMYQRQSSVGFTFSLRALMSTRLSSKELERGCHSRDVSCPKLTLYNPYLSPPTARHGHAHVVTIKKSFFSIAARKLLKGVKRNLSFRTTSIMSIRCSRSGQSSRGKKEARYPEEHLKNLHHEYNIPSFRVVPLTGRRR